MAIKECIVTTTTHVIRCDGDLCGNSEIAHGGTITTAAKEFTEKGWEDVGKHILCPQCMKAMKQHLCSCKMSDAWRCAKEQNSPELACGCSCHKYLEGKSNEKSS